MAEIITIKKLLKNRMYILAEFRKYVQMEEFRTIHELEKKSR